MEEPRRMTRAQTQRLQTAVDENAEAIGAIKDAAGVQARPRRALNNISNKQPNQSAAEKGKLVDVSKASNAATAGVVTRRKSQDLKVKNTEAVPSNNATSAGTDADAETTKTSDGADAQHNHVQPRTARPNIGFTRTLIAKSERVSATTSLVRRTENLQLDAESSPEDMQAVPASPAPDIDAPNMENCLECAEYASDIFTFFRRLEPSVRVPHEYMDNQRYISRQMRAVLIDWLVDVHTKFRLIPESLFLAIWILDRFLSKQEVERRNLQLAGISALVIANKYEEVYGPLLRDYENICAGAYSRADILKMERAILKTLDFGLTVPTAFTFLGRYIKASNFGKYPEFCHLAQYLSIYASFKAFKIEDEDGWPRALRKHSGYSIDQIQTVAAYLVNLMDKASATQYKALYAKFKKKDYSGVARYKAPMKAFEGVLQTAQ